jgi:hypothetical protein
MTAGRPTDYTPKLLKAAWDYVENHEDDLVPSVAGLCDRININRSTAYEWAKDKDKEFSNILEAVSRKQEQKLLKNGLDGTFNPTITKLMLTKHGYSDKQETDLTSGGKPIKNEWHIYPVTTDKHGEG